MRILNIITRFMPSKLSIKPPMEESPPMPRWGVMDKDIADIQKQTPSPNQRASMAKPQKDKIVAIMDTHID